MSRIPALVLAATLAATPAAGQGPPTAPAAPQAPRRQVLSVQPVLALSGLLSGEYERIVSPSLTVGVGASTWGIGVFSYTSADLKARYYPDGRALTGASVGVSAGYSRVGENLVIGNDFSVSAPSAGMMFDYGWLLGDDRRLYAGAGFGAKVLFIDDDRFMDDAFLPRYPTARLSIGYAF
jgi:hypothetical protein